MTGRLRDGNRPVVQGGGTGERRSAAVAGIRRPSPRRPPISSDVTTSHTQYPVSDEGQLGPPRLVVVLTRDEFAQQYQD